MRRHPLAQMLAIGVVAAIVVTVLALIVPWFPKPADTAADKIDTIYHVLLIASVPIFVLVMTVAIYSVVKFRVRPGDMSDGAPIHGHTRLEIVWVTIPFLLVTGLAIYAWIALADIEKKKPHELLVRVVGQQFTWHFEYPQQKVKSAQLVLPVDRPVHFKVNSLDVIHSFWVPEFRLKTDAVPGITTRLRLTPTRTGHYSVVCAELCGLGHSTMRSPVSVVSPQAFDAWVRRQQRPAAAPGAPAGGAAAGKQVFQSAGCAACHTLSDAGATGKVGPNLDGLAKRAGKRRPGLSAMAYVRQSIVDPRAFIVKGFPPNVMPTTFAKQLSKQQIDALVKYLLSVTGGAGK